MNGRFSLGVSALLLACGCSNRASAPVQTPEPQFMRATPIIEHGPPSVEPPPAQVPVAAAAPAALPASQSSDPAPGIEAAPELPAASELGGGRSTAVSSPKTKLAEPRAVIERANAMALQTPDLEGFLGAVMTYTFTPGGIYKVVAAPENVTDLVLEPGEQIMGEPAAGDTLRWRLGVGSSAVGGVPQTHVFLKPTRAGLSTNLTINTNRRTYFLRLESVEETSMVAVQWAYPDAHAGAAAGRSPTTLQKKSANGPSADATALRFDYAIEVVQGSPSWKPQAVFDDGVKTYIRFDPSILHGESPALFVVQRGELQLVNYRVKQNLYVVDRLFQEAELRLGQDDQDIVRIRRW